MIIQVTAAHKSPQGQGTRSSQLQCGFSLGHRSRLHNTSPNRFAEKLMHHIAWFKEKSIQWIIDFHHSDSCPVFRSREKSHSGLHVMSQKKRTLVKGTFGCAWWVWALLLACRVSKRVTRPAPFHLPCLELISAPLCKVFCGALMSKLRTSSSLIILTALAVIILQQLFGAFFFFSPP